MERPYGMSSATVNDYIASGEGFYYPCAPVSRPKHPNLIQLDFQADYKSGYLGAPVE